MKEAIDTLLAAAAVCALLFNSFNLIRMQHRAPAQITEQDPAK